jgi:TP901 family phage tail tape measure protein
MPTMLVKINVDDKGNVAIQKLAANAGKAQPKVKSLGNTMKNAFAVIGVYKGINMLSAKLMQATSEALKFEKAMKKIQAIGNESGATMGNMGKDIEKLALTTEHSFTQIAEAQLGISKAGIRGAEGMEVLKSALDLATVSGEEQGATSEGLINILNAFNMGTDQAGYAANVMSRALNETILNLEEYLEAMKYTAPVASQLGVSFEELSAMIGILAQTGQRGSLAGTGLRNDLLNLLKITPAVAASLKDVKIEEMGVTQLLELMHKNGVPVVDLLKQFNKRGILSAMALGKNAEAIYELQSRLTDLSRPLNVVADEMRDNLLDKLQMVNDHFVMILNTLNKEMGFGADTFLDNMMAKMVDFNETLKDNPEMLKAWTDTFVSLGKTLNILIPIMGFAVDHSREILIALSVSKLISITNNFKVLGTTMKTAFTGSLGPVGLLITSLTTMYILAKDITEQFKAMYEEKRLSNLEDPVVKRIITLETLIELYEKLQSSPDNITDILPEIKNLENNLAGLGTEIDLTAGSQEKLNQAYAEYNKIMRTTASVGIGEKDKIPKPYGAFPTLPEVKEKKGRKEREDSFGKLFDMHNIQGGFQESLKRLQAGWTDIVFPVDIEANDEAKREIEEFVEDSLNKLKKLQEVKIDQYEGINTFSKIYSTVLDVYNPVMDAISERREYLHERQLQIFNEEMQAASERYEIESKAAGDSALQKSLAENKYQKEQEKIREKVRQENKKAAKAAWKADMMKIGLGGATLSMSLIGSLADSGVPAYVAIPLGIGLAAGVTSVQLGVAAANNPADAYFTGGWVRGNGNGTSDNINIRASRGEYVLSRDDIDRLGGDSAINRMVSFGDTNNSSTTTIYIDTVIGEESYVRKNIIPRIKEELRR